MQRILKYIISENTTPVTILDFLKKEGFSRHILSSMKNTPNTIILNGERGFGRSVLKPQDHLIVTVPETESGENIIRTKMDLNIIYEDEDILVINKPADMPVHPSAGNYENTLANGIAWYFAEKGEDFVYRCINRLDRDTTGALILAKNPLSAAILSVQMKKRQILRTYLALVDGLLPDSGTINAPIARMEGSVITREVNFGTGESAITHYERLAAGKEYSLAELHLETGRTHQIRVHMKYIGHTLFNDERYGGNEILKGTTSSKYKQFVDNCFAICPRQALHAKTLGFVHPTTGEEMFFDSEIPADMTALIDKWRVYANTKEL